MFTEAIGWLVIEDGLIPCTLNLAEAAEGGDPLCHAVPGQVSPKIVTHQSLPYLFYRTGMIYFSQSSDVD
jgi:hypothetical protein